MRFLPTLEIIHIVFFIFINITMLQSITWAPWQSILSPVLSSTRSSSCNISNSELFLFLSLNFSFYHLVKKLSSSRQSSHFCFCPKPHINILTTKHLISVVFRCLCSSCVGVHDGTAPQLSESKHKDSFQN